jgi:hypothetical protein
MFNEKIIFFVLIFFIFAGLLAVPQKQKSKTTETSISFSKMKSESEMYFAKITKIKTKVDRMISDAVKEKDIRWKMCLDDVKATLTGIVASANSAISRMNDLIKINKADAALSQMVLVRSLNESSKKSMADAFACQKQVVKFDTKTRVDTEIDKKIVGDSSSSVSDSMGVNFDKGFIAKGDKYKISGSDSEDSAGTGSDNAGETGTGKSSTSEDSWIDDISNPIIIDPSPTK